MLKQKRTKWVNKLEDRNLKTRDLLRVVEFSESYNATLHERNFELNNTLNLIAKQNQILDQDNRMLRTKNYHQKNKLIDVCQDQASQLATTNFTLNRLRQSYGQLQWKAGFINDNLKNEIMSMDLRDHEKSVELERVLIQMRERLVQKDIIIHELHLSIMALKQQNEWLRQENNNFKITQYSLKIDDEYGKRKEEIKQILKNNEKSEQYLKMRNKELLKENQELKKQAISDKDKKFDLEEELQKNRGLIEELKRMLTDRDSRNKDWKKMIQPPNISRQIPVDQQQQNKSIKDKHLDTQFDTQLKQGIEVVNIQQFLSSIPSLRNGINRQMMEIFTESLKEGEEEKRNPLSVFLLKWKQLEVDRITPFTKSYIQASSALASYLKQNIDRISKENKQKFKQILPTSIYEAQPVKVPEKIQSKSPYVYKTHLKVMRKKQRTNRSQINKWVLSSIQFTNNQHSVENKNIKSCLLYLFRLLTIQYRIMYPTKGKQGQYQIEEDVRNCLLHYIVIAVGNIIQIV